MSNLQTKPLALIPDWIIKLAGEIVREFSVLSEYNGELVATGEMAQFIWEVYQEITESESTNE